MRHPLPGNPAALRIRDAPNCTRRQCGTLLEVHCRGNLTGREPHHNLYHQRLAIISFRRVMAWRISSTSLSLQTAIFADSACVSSLNRQSIECKLPRVGHAVTHLTTDPEDIGIITHATGWKGMTNNGESTPMETLT
jgi:hypothetical protein